MREKDWLMSAIAGLTDSDEPQQKPIGAFRRTDLRVAIELTKRRIEAAYNPDLRVKGRLRT